MVLLQGVTFPMSYSPGLPRLDLGQQVLKKCCPVDYQVIYLKYKHIQLFVNIFEGWQPSFGFRQPTVRNLCLMGNCFTKCLMGLMHPVLPTKNQV